jgi:hypothetical protein
VNVSLLITWLGLEKTTCYYNHLNLAKMIVERCRSLLNFKLLHDALPHASSQGHSEVVQWLLGEMKLSHDDSVTWLLATASACGDIDTVKLLFGVVVTQEKAGYIEPA